VDGDVANAIELSKKLGGSTTVRQCMLKQVYEYMTARDAALDKDEDGSDVDKCRVDGLDKALVDKKGDLREAIVAWVKSPDFVWRPAQAQ
jgi:hypothetical protein